MRSAVIVTVSWESELNPIRPHADRAMTKRCLLPTIALAHAARATVNVILEAVFEGASIGQYRLLRRIGEGGMGAVYLAEHALVGRRAAIKVLLPELSARRDIVERFFNEARAMTAVPDPGIVQMYDFGFHSDGSAYIVMELLEGETLDQRLQRVNMLMPAEALRITRQVAGSLAAAHARGIVHRDLKLENIFMVRDQEALGGERPKVLDFGIAKLGGETGRNVTMAGAMIGTPIYMSPEQCRGAGQIDYRSDIYSLGCVLFYLLTGRPPFDVEGLGNLLSAHMHSPAPPPSMWVQGLPPGIDPLVLRCLAKNPAERFQSMQELQAACDQLLKHISAHPASATVALGVPLPPGFRSATPGAGTAHLSSSVQPKPTTLSAAAGQTGASMPPRRRTGLLIGLGVGLVGGIVAIAVFASGGKNADPAPAAEPVAKEPAPAPVPVPAPVAAPAPAAAPTPVPAPAPAPVATPPAVDAGVEVARPTTKPVTKPTTKPTTKPQTKPPTPKPSSDDLYDDR